MSYNLCRDTDLHQFCRGVVPTQNTRILKSIIMQQAVREITEMDERIEHLHQLSDERVEQRAKRSLAGVLARGMWP